MLGAGCTTSIAEAHQTGREGCAGGATIVPRPEEGVRPPRTPDRVDCVPASGVTPLRVMLCVVHYAVQAWVVSITSGSAGRAVSTVASGGVSMAMEVSER